MGARRETVAEQDVRPTLTQVLGDNIYRRRVMRLPRWSQEDLAEAADVGVNTISALEIGRDPTKRQAPYPQLDTIEKLAEALGCDPSDLLQWNPTRANLHAVPSGSLIAHGALGAAIQAPLLASARA